MIVDLFLVYQFIRRLATPFNKWPAYKEGVIDADGNILKKKKDRNTTAEKKSFGKYDLMILKLKKLLGKVPGGSSRLASYAAALWLIKEWKHFSEDSLLNESVTEDQIDKSIDIFNERYSYYITLAEDVNKKVNTKPALDEINIHPDVVKAYKKTLDADDKAADYNYRGNKARVTRANNHLSKMINKHHPGLDMKGKINLRTKLQIMNEDLDEARKPAPVRWKRAGASGEIEATIGGKKYKIEKALDHNERHKGEWKVMVWDKRTDDWEWETTEYGKANAKAWIMGRMNEEPVNNVGSGNIAGMDGGHMSKAAQKKWTSSNKLKKKKLRDIIGANT